MLTPIAVHTVLMSFRRRLLCSPLIRIREVPLVRDLALLLLLLLLLLAHSLVQISHQGALMAG